MKTIRLLRDAAASGDRGPGRGMRALQAALRAENWPWLKVGGALQPGEIPWVWSYKDAGIAVQFNEFGWPFLLGPNVLFVQSSRPGEYKYEKQLLDAEHCRLMMTESPWYAQLIQSHCNHNEAPIVLWSYPIDPIPAGPLEPEFDLFIYLKDFSLGREAIRAQQHFPRNSSVVYGHYNRDGMLECARRSKACLYLASDDRGPLAAAEIAMCGAPLVGIERGCPWVTNPKLGIEVPHFAMPDLFAACEKAMQMDRAAVRAAALEQFATSRTVAIIRDAILPIVTE